MASRKRVERLLQTSLCGPQIVDERGGQPDLPGNNLSDSFDKCRYRLGSRPDDQTGLIVHERVVVDPVHGGQPSPGEIDIQFVRLNKDHHTRARATGTRIPGARSSQKVKEPRQRRSTPIYRVETSTPFCTITCPPLTRKPSPCTDGEERFHISRAGSFRLRFCQCERN